MARKKDRQKRKKSRGGSTLKEHKQVRKTLLPPLAQLGVQLSSWAKNMLPEMLWADCLLTHYEFNQAGGVFHRALDVVDEFMPGGSKEIVTGLVSSFALVPAESRAEVRRVLHEEGLDEVVFPETFRQAISLYEECPMGWLFEDWRREARVEPEVGITYLKGAARRLLASRSKHATRCRMFGIARMAKHGRIHFILGQTDHVARELSAYSDAIPEEEQLKTEATLRAMFGGLFSLSEAGSNAWPPYFWRHNYKISLCEQLKDEAPAGDASDIIRGALRGLREAFTPLKAAYRQATAQADLDLYAPDRDEVLFGLVSRQFRVFSVLAEDPRLWSPDLGLMLHRVMADTQIVLAYLIHKNDPALYERFKRYSLGKQKLYKLHLSDYAERMGLDLSDVEDELEERINSELFEELLPIELGSVFEGTDMRKMAYEVKLEDLYRLVYSPTSAELHGEWVSLKEHNLTLCVNPLHGFHHLPKLESDGMLSTGVVLRAGAILGDTVETWLRAYGLESKHKPAVETFKAGVADAFDGPVSATAGAT